MAHILTDTKPMPLIMTIIPFVLLHFGLKTNFNQLPTTFHTNQLLLQHGTFHLSSSNTLSIQLRAYNSIANMGTLFVLLFCKFNTLLPVYETALCSGGYLIYRQGAEQNVAAQM